MARASRVRPATSPTSARPQRDRILVRPRSFVVIWWSIHSAGALGMRSLHRESRRAACVHTAVPDVCIYSTASRQIPRPYLLLAGRVFRIVAFLHVYVMLRMVVNSIRMGQLCFRRPPPSTRVNKGPPSTRSTIAKILTPWRIVRRVWNRYFGLDGVWGLNGKHFDAIFRGHEALEALLQTYQAYQLSTLMPSRWLNQLAVRSCVLTPLIQYKWRHHQSMRHFLCLTADTVLDLCGSVVVPFAIAYNAAMDYDWENGLFPIELVYDYMWTTNAVLQARQLYVLSLIDYVTTMILPLSVVGCVLTIAAVLERQDSAVCPVATHGSASPSTTIVKQPSWRHHLCSHWADITTVAWAMMVLGAHIAANLNDTQRTVPACAQGVHTWFVSKPGCTVHFVHCHKLAIDGSASQIALILDQVDRSTLLVLAIVHCPFFTMPDIIQEFSEIRNMEITNTTIKDWSLSAAIHQDKHPYFSHILLGHVNVTEVLIPRGLFHANLPRAMTDLDFQFTNISMVPDTVGEY